jgi:hypothetical protein
MGLRVYAKVSEPPARVSDATTASERAPSVELGPVSSPLVPSTPAGAAQPQPTVASAEEPVLAPGPDPAVVAIRSEPKGAAVFRDGQRLGATPISLLVKPHEEFVRIELRLEGYQPLAAELTAKDGERLLKLSQAPQRQASRLRRATRVQRRSSPQGATSNEAPKEPSGGPYERFE